MHDLFPPFGVPFVRFFDFTLLWFLRFYGPAVRVRSRFLFCFVSVSGSRPAAAGRSIIKQLLSPDPRCSVPRVFRGIGVSRSKYPFLTARIPSVVLSRSISFPFVHAPPPVVLFRSLIELCFERRTVILYIGPAAFGGLAFISLLFQGDPFAFPEKKICA